MARLASLIREHDEVESASKSIDCDHGFELALGQVQRTSVEVHIPCSRLHHEYLEIADALPPLQVGLGLFIQVWTDAERKA